MREVVIIIKGRPYSKKNSRKFRQTGRAKYTVPSDNFISFENDAISQLANLSDSYRFGSELLYIDYTFLKPGNELQDVDNAICSVNDVLQHKLIRIFDNDKQIMSGKFDVYPGSKVWETHIRIRQLYCNPDEHSFDLIARICRICKLPKDSKQRIKKNTGRRDL